MQNLNSKKYIIIIVAIVLIAGGVFFAFKNFGSENLSVPATSRARSLTTIVKEETFKDTISASGTVYLKEETSIYAEEESLTIGRFLVEEGETIEEGQAILEYDIESRKEELEKSIRNLELNLKNEKLNLQNVLLPASETEKINLENSVIQAERNLIDARNNLNNYESNLSQKQQTVNDALRTLENAQKTYEQNVALYEIGGVTESALSDSKYDVEKAQVSYDNAVSQLKEFENSKESLELAVKSAENTLQQSKINLENADNPLSTEAAKINYQKTLNSISSIEDDLATYKKDLQELPYYAYSTVSGTVTSIPVDEGSKTQENTAILKVADLNQLIVKASISEYDAPNIEVGQTVEMTSDGIEDKVYYGTITKINHSASSANTNLGSETVVPIEISVENGDEILKPGYTLDLEILVVNQENVISINTSSIVEDTETGLNYIFVVKDGKVTKTPVEVGLKSSGKAQVLSGINFGDEIITSASSSIKDGMTLDEIQELSIQTSTSQTNNEGGKSNDSDFGFGKDIQPGGNQGGGFEGNMPRG